MHWSATLSNEFLASRMIVSQNRWSCSKWIDIFIQQQTRQLHNFLPCVGWIISWLWVGVAFSVFDAFLVCRYWSIHKIPDVLWRECMCKRRLWLWLRSSDWFGDVDDTTIGTRLPLHHLLPFHPHIIIINSSWFLSHPVVLAVDCLITKPNSTLWRNCSSKGESSSWQTSFIGSHCNSFPITSVMSANHGSAHLFWPYLYRKYRRWCGAPTWTRYR